MELNQNLKLLLLEITVAKTKRKPIDWERTFTMHISDKEHVSRRYKEFSWLKNENENNSIKIGKWFEKTQQQRRHQMANKHLEKFSTSLVISEKQIKTTMKWHYTTFRVTMSKKRLNKPSIKGNEPSHTQLVRITANHEVGVIVEREKVWRLPSLCTEKTD